MFACAAALDQLRLAVRGEEDDGDGPRLGDALGRLDAIDQGHFDVEDRQVGLSRDGKGYRLLAGARLSHHPVSQRGQLRPQAQQADALVIGDQDAE